MSADTQSGGVAGSPDGGGGRPGGGRARHSWRAFVLTWRKARHDRILGLAAEAGFWALVSLPSLLLAVFGAIGYLSGVLGPSSVAHVRTDVLRAAGVVLTPSAVGTFVTPVVDQVLAKGRATVISTGFVISLWSGSTAMSDYLNTITIAYGLRGLRGTVRNRLVALRLYLTALVVGLVLLPALTLGPDVISELSPGSVEHQVSLAVHVVYFPLVGLGTVALLAYLYKACLPVRTPWRRSLPGALTGTVLWLAFSIGVRAYLTSSFRSRSAYGSLGAPLAALLFFYFTALAVLLGAELNAALDSLHPEPATAEARRTATARLASTTEALTDPALVVQAPPVDVPWRRRARGRAAPGGFGAARQPVPPPGQPPAVGYGYGSPVPPDHPGDLDGPGDHVGDATTEMDPGGVREAG